MGGNSFRLVAAGDLGRVAALPGVEQVLPAGDGAARVLLAPGADRASVLREMVVFLDVREFVGAEPELEEIFVRAVRDAA
jgi:ABC-type uncharacterized transport system ATPase subunit